VRVVLDTAALISAIRSSSGASAEIVRLAILERFTLLMDYKLACEYKEVALRPQHVAASGKSPEDVEAVINALESIATPVFVRTMLRPLSRDANDDMVLDVAINGHADVIVTNNVKDFAPAAGRIGIQVLTPREFLIEAWKGGFIYAGKSEEEHSQ
jgi:putative PIN family toxin of toxin-antitoxin system